MLVWNIFKKIPILQNCQSLNINDAADPAWLIRKILQIIQVTSAATVEIFENPQVHSYTKINPGLIIIYIYIHMNTFMYILTDNHM